MIPAAFALARAPDRRRWLRATARIFGNDTYSSRHRPHSAASVARPRLFAIDARLSFLLKSCAMAGAKKIK